MTRAWSPSRPRGTRPPLRAVAEFFHGSKGADQAEDHDEALALNPVVQAKLVLESEAQSVRPAKFKAGRGRNALKKLGLTMRRLGNGERAGGDAKARKLKQLDKNLAIDAQQVSATVVPTREV